MTYYRTELLELWSHLRVNALWGSPPLAGSCPERYPREQWWFMEILSEMVLCAYYRLSWGANSFWNECVWSFQMRTWSFICWIQTFDSNHLLYGRLNPSVFLKIYLSYFTLIQYSKYLLAAPGVPYTGVTKMNDLLVPVFEMFMV